MKKKKSALLLISAILGLLYSIYIISYFTGTNASTNDTAEAIGVGLATMLVMPHMICTVLATLFNLLGWAMSHRGFALTGGILYAVSAATFPLYALFVVPQIVLSFVGFAKLKNLNAPKEETLPV